MGIISKIQVQKNNKNRFNIYMDNGVREEYAFAVSEDTLIKFHLSKGKEIDELEIEEILFTDQIQKALQLAMNYLSYRMRTKKEIVTYLNEKEIDELEIEEILFADQIQKALQMAMNYLSYRMRTKEEIVTYLNEKEIEPFVVSEVIKKLEEQRLINDEQFALSYVRTQMNTSMKGPEVIAQELKDKGVSSHIIEVAIVEYPFDIQLDHAKKLIEKYAPKYSKDSYKTMMQKVEMTLKRKGYSFTIIQEAMNEVEIAQDTDEEWENVVKQGEKYKKKYASLPPYEYKAKLKGALYRKGFPMELIDKYVEEEY